MRRVAIDSIRLIVYSIVTLGIFNVCLFAIDALVYGAMLSNNDVTYALRRKTTIEKTVNESEDDRGNAIEPTSVALIDNGPARITSIDRAYNDALRERASEANVRYPLFDQSIGCEIWKNSRALLSDNRNERFAATANLFPKYVRCAFSLYR